MKKIIQAFGIWPSYNGNIRTVGNSFVGVLAYTNEGHEKMLLNFWS